MAVSRTTYSSFSKSVGSNTPSLACACAAVPVPIVVHRSLPSAATWSDQPTKLASATLPTTSVRYVSASASAAGLSMATVGGARSLGSLTDRTKVAVVALPALSVAVAITDTGPGAAGVYAKVPSACRTSAAPPAASVSDFTPDGSVAATPRLSGWPTTTRSVDG